MADSRNNSVDIRNVQFCGSEIEFDQVLDGDLIGSTNYLFSEIGKPVPIQPKLSFNVHDSLPVQPLVVSHRFHLLFVAHADGFYVARTEEVITSAEKMKNDGSGPSIQELSIANVHVGKVSILALSAGDSLLAASVANELHFFPVSSLLHKEQKPSYSILLEDSSCIKDMKWASTENKAYVILSSNRKLYHGYGQGSPVDVMDNVDSVEWSAKGEFVAVARKNNLSLLSSEFVEKFRFSLSPNSLLVDCIKWTRPDSIVLGCFEEDEDSDQANYLVQVICIQGQEITEASSKPTVHTFRDIFLNFQADSVHADGPNLFLSYLDHQDLAFIANRRNLSQHVVLLHWSSDGKRCKASAIEILHDHWNAHIESQENGDDNVLLAIATDKVFQETEVKFNLDGKEVSPCYILLCLTIDGKLALFHFASAVAPSFSSEALAETGGKEVACHDVLSENMPLKVSSSKVVEENTKIKPFDMTSTNDGKKELDLELLKEDAAGDKHISESYQKGKSHGDSTFGKQVQQTILSLRTPIDDHEQKSQLNRDRLISQSVFLEKPSDLQFPQASYLERLDSMAVNIRDAEPRSFADAKSHSNSSPGKMLANLSSPALSESVHVHGSVGFPQETISTEMSSTPSLNLSSGIATSYATRSSASNNSSGHNAPCPTRNFDSLPSFSNSQLSLRKKLDSGRSSRSRPGEESYAAPFQTKWSNSEQNLSKQLHNVDEMAKGMDYLLEAIEGRGGFMDALIDNQESSVATLEEGLRKLSEGCTIWKGLFDERIEEIKLLLDRTVQALARKTYVEGIFKQATDSHYWDLWNGQKLSSELELKRRLILEVNQDLTAQLFELERHFNALELTKFGGNRVQMNRGAMSRLGKSSQIQSLHSLRNIRNTVGAQLTVAQKLSECLSKQMASLSMESHVDKQNIKKELFETIGLTYDCPFENSPGKEKASSTPQRNQLWKTSFSAERNESSMENHVTPRGIPEPESVRRRRESLDQNWSSYEPPRATVRRQKMCNDRSLQKVEKQCVKLQPKKESVVVHTASDKSTPPAYESKRKVFRMDGDNTRAGISKMAGEDSPALLQQSSLITASGLYGKSRFVQQCDIFNSDLAFVTQRNSAKTATLVEDLCDNQGASSKSPNSFNSTVCRENNALPITQFLMSEVSCKASPSHPETVSSTPSYLNSSTPGLRKAEKQSHHAGTFVSSLSVDLHPSINLPANSSYPKQITEASSSAISEADVPSSAQVYRDVNLTASQSKASLSSVSSFPPTLPISTKDDSLQATTSSVTHVVSLYPESVPQSVAIPSKDDLTFAAEIKPLNSTSLIGDTSKSLTSVSQIQPSIVSPELKIDGKMTSTPVPDVLPKLNSEKQLNVHHISTPVSDSGSNVKAQQFHVPGKSLHDVMVNFETTEGEKSGNSDMIFHEDEMEEEASEASLATELSQQIFGGFGIGSSPDLTSVKANPFGGMAVQNHAAFPMSSPFTQAPKTELFRPASFSFQSPLPLQSSQPTSSGNFANSDSSVPPASGFVQPAQIGSLGTVLGTFGQSRRIGGGLPGVGVVSSTSFASSSPTMPTDGFASGGFASLARNGGGGFAAAGAGGFAAAATAANGFAGAATGASGFVGAGLGTFGNMQGGGSGFSGFGSSASGRPPSNLFTQMRK